METDRCTSVAVHEQILNERDKNYAKVVARYSLTGKSAFEDLVDHGETRNTLIFQDFARIRYPPNRRQIQSKSRPGRNLTFR